MRTSLFCNLIITNEYPGTDSPKLNISVFELANGEFLHYRICWLYSVSISLTFTRIRDKCFRFMLGICHDFLIHKKQSRLTHISDWESHFAEYFLGFDSAFFVLTCTQVPENKLYSAIIEILLSIPHKHKGSLSLLKLVWHEIQFEKFVLTFPDCFRDAHVAEACSG